MVLTWDPFSLVGMHLGAAGEEQGQNPWDEEVVETETWAAAAEAANRGDSRWEVDMSAGRQGDGSADVPQKCANKGQLPHFIPAGTLCSLLIESLQVLDTQTPRVLS